MEQPGVLVIHNRYCEPGGEDAVVSAEIDLLRRAGHRVLQYARHNREIASFGKLRKACLAMTATWDHESYTELRRLIAQERPAIAHCHNLLPLLSPAAYYACAAEGVPVVQTVHNCRMACPGGSFFRDDAHCDECHGSLGTAVLRGCYHHSLAQTAAVALMLGTHRTLGTWQQRVATYIAPSNFCRDVLLSCGLPAQRVAVKPHFVAPMYHHRQGDGEYAIFAGRLCAEKGIMPLLHAWRGLRHIPLLVVGSGPLEDAARHFVAHSRTQHIRFTGQLSRRETSEQISRARFLVAPSLCDETFGMAVLDAAACGVPAIVSSRGALPELVSDGQTGLVFYPPDCGLQILHSQASNSLDFHSQNSCPQDSGELTDRVQWAWSHPAAMRQMGMAALATCLAHYSPENNYRQLLDIYRSALHSPGPPPLPPLYTQRSGLGVHSA